MEHKPSNNHILTLVMLIVSIIVILALVNVNNGLQKTEASSIFSHVYADQPTSSNSDYILIWKTAKWCSLCATNKINIDKIMPEFTNYVTLVEVDVDEKPELASFLDSAPPPSLLLYKKNGELITKIDYRDPDIIRNILVTSVDLRS